ncbi:MAG TPA: hypothetical protein VMS37_13835 [Verrucomicrobiae bacterium]|nr:hypothetical protein [Patescibacteria group bacterium]HXK03480.1 hypothetical protein [Verrucomicrobiae bacterium]
MSTTPAPASSAGSGGSSNSKSSGSGIQIGFLLEFVGAAAVIAAAFFSPLPERIAVLSGVGAFAVGRFFPRISK